MGNSFTEMQDSSFLYICSEYTINTNWMLKTAERSGQKQQLAETTDS